MRIKSLLAALPVLFLFLRPSPASGAAAARVEGQASSASSPAQAEERPDAGSVSDNVYSNRFFGFTYQFPKGWMVSQAERSSRERPSPARPEVRILLFAFQHHNLPELSTILVRAVKLSSPDMTAKQFLLDEYPALQRRGAKPQGPPKEVSIGGWQFFSSTFKAKVGGGIISEEDLVTIQKGYALAFDFISNQEGVFKALHKTMESLAPLNPAAASSSAAEKPEPAARPENMPRANVPTAKETIEGTVSGNVYRNSFFGLSYEFPQELKVMSQAETLQVARAGHEAIYGNEPENDAEHRAAERVSIMLLHVVRPRQEKPSVGEMILLTAEDVSAIPLVSAKEYMVQLARAMASSPLRFQLLHKVAEHRSGEHRFAKAEFKASVGDQGKQIPLYVTYMGTIWKGYALIWQFAAGSERGLKVLVETIDSVTLESPPNEVKQ